MRRRAVVGMLALMPPLVAVMARSRRASAAPAAPHLVTDYRTSSPLFADRDRLYWVARDAILSVSKRGGEPTPAVTGNVDPLALFGDRLVFEERPPDAGSSLEPRSLIKSCRTGDPRTVTTLATGRSMIHGATADASGVYFHEQQDSEFMLLFHLPWSGGKARELAEVSNEPGGLLADATHLYWGSIGGAIYAVPKQGGVPEVVGHGQSSTGAVAVDEHSVYFTNTEAGTLSRAPKRGGQTVKLATARKSVAPYDVGLHGQLDAVVLHGAHVYYVDNDIYARVAAVRRVPKTGGRAETVVERPGCTIEDLVTDGKLWFWVEKIEKNGAKDRFPIMSLPL